MMRLGIAALLVLALGWTRPAPPDPLLAPMALALDTAMQRLRAPDAVVAIAPDSKVYLRETMFHAERGRVWDDRLPRRWVDSLVKVHRLTGRCSGRARVCDVAFTGYLLSFWRPEASGSGYAVTIDVQEVRIQRPTFSDRPPLQPDSISTPARDQLEVRFLRGHRVRVMVQEESANGFRVVGYDMAPL